MIQKIKKKGWHMFGENNVSKRPEVRAKISKALKGRPFSEEHLKNLRNSTTVGRHGKLSEEHKKNIGIANKGKKRSKEARFKISLAIKGRVPWNKGKRYVCNCSDKVKLFRRDRMLKGGAVYCNKFISNPSKPQVRLFEYLKYFYSGCVLNYSYQFSDIKHYSLDIAIPSEKICFEYDGEYWHSFDERQVQDFVKDERLIEDGWVVCRIKGLEDLNNFII